MNPEQMDRMVALSIERKAKIKAMELGIEFQVKLNRKEWNTEFLVRIKNTLPKIAGVLSKEELEADAILIKKRKEFVDYISKIIVPEYAYEVRFSYPSKF